MQLFLYASLCDTSSPLNPPPILSPFVYTPHLPLSSIPSLEANIGRGVRRELGEKLSMVDIDYFWLEVCEGNSWAGLSHMLDLGTTIRYSHFAWYEGTQKFEKKVW